MLDRPPGLMWGTGRAAGETGIKESEKREFLFVGTKETKGFVRNE